MHQRFVTCMGLLSVLLGTSVPAASQIYETSKPTVGNQAKAWTVPRKPDGRPISKAPGAMPAIHR